MSPSDAEEPTEDQQVTLSAEDEKYLEALTKKFFLHPPGEPWTPSTADKRRIRRLLAKSLKYFAEHYPETPSALLEPVLRRGLKDGVNTHALLKDKERFAKAFAINVRQIRRKYPQAQQGAVLAATLQGLLETALDFPRAYRAGEVAFTALSLQAYDQTILALKREKLLDHDGVPYRAGSPQRPKPYSQLSKEERRNLYAIQARPLLSRPHKTFYDEAPATPEDRPDHSPQAPQALAASHTEAPTIQDNLFHHPGLTAKESIVLRARYPYGENRTWPEVAEKLAMTEITAKRHHARALTKLYGLLVAQVAAMRAASEPVTPASVAAKLAVSRAVAKLLISEMAPPKGPTPHL